VFALVAVWYFAKPVPSTAMNLCPVDRSALWMVPLQLRTELD